MSEDHKNLCASDAPICDCKGGHESAPCFECFTSRHERCSKGCHLSAYRTNEAPSVPEYCGHQTNDGPCTRTKGHVSQSHWHIGEAEARCFHVESGKRCTRYLEGADSEREAVVKWLRWEADHRPSPTDQRLRDAAAIIESGKHLHPKTRTCDRKTCGHTLGAHASGRCRQCPCLIFIETESPRTDNAVHDLGAMATEWLDRWVNTDEHGPNLRLPLLGLLDRVRLAVPRTETAETSSATQRLVDLTQRVAVLESALRPFSNTVCSMRWLWDDTDDETGEERAKDDGLTSCWSELLDAHAALHPNGCDAELCAPSETGSEDKP